MAEDRLLTALERRRKEARILRILRDPIGVFRENPLRLGYISGAIGGCLMFLAYLYGWEFVAPTDAYILAALVAAIPPTAYLYVEQKRERKADNEFPGLLRDLAQAKRAGLTLIDAFSLTAEGNYGVLTDGLRTLVCHLTWGISFEDALRMFARRYPTRIIKRSIAIIIEGYRVGGDVGEILKVAADDVMELRTLEKERISDMSVYVIICYTIFFVFLGVLLVLYHSFIPMMVEASARVEGTGMGGMFTAIKDVEKMKMLFFHCGIIQGVCTGLVAGKMGEGKVIAGLKHATVLALATFFFFALLKIVPPMTAPL
ncbi:MAG: type II secretion system F family protein [Methanomicrobia archaeon]|nr:type II secretion system F family protein [Methanomicrobia archaeon]